MKYTPLEINHDMDKKRSSQPSDNLAAALIEFGHVEFRQTDAGDSRGLFCGMGICGECRVHVPGKGTVRACMTPSDYGTDVDPHRSDRLPDVPSSAETDALDVNTTPDVLIVGAGPAGLAAAETCANSGLSVVLLDERSAPGGQFYKQPAGSFFARLKRDPDTQAKDGEALIARARAAGATILNQSVVWSAGPDLRCNAIVQGNQYEFAPKRLILATGAFERPHAFPGWTLPGVMTTGAVQTMLRSYGVVAGKRIFIAGNGPLNFQVAAEVLKAGGTVVGIAEAAPAFAAGRIFEMLRAAIFAPSLVLRGAGYRAFLKKAGVPIFTSCAVSKVEKDGTDLAVSLTDVSGKKSAPQKTIIADTVSLGYGFLPNTDLARLVGCHHETNPDGSLAVTRNEEFETSVSGVYQIGDSARLEGAPAALSQGIITALAIVRDLTGQDVGHPMRAALKSLRNSRGFQTHLWRAFKAPSVATRFSSADTIICRCESVRRSDIDAMIAEGESPGNIKRATRCGMGACQGRYCGWLLQQLLLENGREVSEVKTHWAPRAPIRPMPMKLLASDPNKDGHLPDMPRL